MSYPYRYAPGVRLSGQVGKTMVNNMVHDDIVHIMQKHGLDNLDPAQYYDADQFIGAFVDLQEETNSMTNLVALGIAVIENTSLPADIDEWSLEQQLSLPVHAYENFMYEDKLPGNFEIRWLSDSHVAYHESLVWPDHFIYGYIFAFVKRFLAPQYDFVVEYDQTLPRQDDGADETVIHVIWEPRT